MASVFLLKEKTKHICIQGPAVSDTESSMKLGASVFSAYMLRTERFWPWIFFALKGMKCL